MTKLIFMPWYNVPKKIDIGDYEIHPFHLKKANLALTHVEEDVKIILGNYLDAPFTLKNAQSGGREVPISSASIIVDKKDKIEDEIEILQYILTICALSPRKFLNDGYLCSENLKIYVQKYHSPIKGEFAPFVEKRRKGGGAGFGWIPGYFREVRPLHIPGQPSFGVGLEFDDTLANILWRMYVTDVDLIKEVWKYNIFPSLFSYYEANTDAKLQQSDCIYSHTAIERLLLGEGYKEDEIIRAVIKLLDDSKIKFSPISATTRNWSSILKKKNPSSGSVDTLFEGWLREHTRLRNSFAHGNHSTDLTLIWTIEEHLLISAYLYPLLLKLKLSQLSIGYKLETLDTQRLILFECLLAIPEGLFMVEHEPNTGETHWGKIYEAAFFGGIIEDTALEHGFVYGESEDKE